MLSSGFLAFAYHAGFLQAVNQVSRGTVLTERQHLGIQHSSLALALQNIKSAAVVQQSLYTQADLDVQGVMGTSSGALSGSLYAAGYSPHQVWPAGSFGVPLCRICSQAWQQITTSPFELSVLHRSRSHPALSAFTAACTAPALTTTVCDPATSATLHLRLCRSQMSCAACHQSRS